MPRYMTTEPAEVVLTTLADALDAMDFGVVLLDRELRVTFINRRCQEIWSTPSGLLNPGATFRELLESAAAQGWYAAPAVDLPSYLEEREAEVRAGSTVPVVIQLADQRHILFRCAACPNGGRVLTYTDISRELRHEASEAMARVSAELRFNSEVMEDQAAHLATLAEAAEESAQKAEAARLQLEHEVAERRQLELKLRLLATTDGLTGALNRVELLAAAQRELDAVRGSGGTLSALMLDVDHFKAINDCYGHAGGDRALSHLAAMLRAGIRQIDLLGRLGGEEFAVVLPATSLAAAEGVAERLRANIAESAVEFGEVMIPMTISIGVATQMATEQSIEQILARADDALYAAKRGGRNRVVVADHCPEEAA